LREPELPSCGCRNRVEEYESARDKKTVPHTRSVIVGLTPVDGIRKTRAMANTDVNQEIRARIQSFVGELSELVKQATLESVQAALQGTGGQASTRRGGRKAAVLASAARRAKGSKRTAEELDALVATLLKYIQSNPGQRMEQLAASLGIPSKELTLPIKKLLQENRLRTKGQKRATAYFAR
jgi:hypothetical protein